jgi:hypothetical protein
VCEFCRIAGWRADPEERADSHPALQPLCDNCIFHDMRNQLLPGETLPLPPSLRTMLQVENSHLHMTLFNAVVLNHKSVARIKPKGFTSHHSLQPRLRDAVRAKPNRSLYTAAAAVFERRGALEMRCPHRMDVLYSIYGRWRGVYQYLAVRHKPLPD